MKFVLLALVIGRVRGGTVTFTHHPPSMVAEPLPALSIAYSAHVPLGPCR